MYALEKLAGVYKMTSYFAFSFSEHGFQVNLEK